MVSVKIPCFFHVALHRISARVAHQIPCCIVCVAFSCCIFVVSLKTAFQKRNTKRHTPCFKHQEFIYSTQKADDFHTFLCKLCTIHLLFCHWGNWIRTSLTVQHTSFILAYSCIFLSFSSHNPLLCCTPCCMLSKYWFITCDTSASFSSIKCWYTFFSMFGVACPMRFIAYLSGTFSDSISEA